MRRLVPADLDGMPWIILSHPAQSGGREELLAACGRAGFTPDIRSEAADRASVLGLVSAGCGFAFVPASARRTLLPGVRLRELAFFQGASRLFLVRRVAGTVPAALALADELVAARRL